MLAEIIKNHFNPTRPLFLVYAHDNESTIAQRLGKAEYSYFFVLKSYIPMLERIGDVVRVSNPKEEIAELLAANSEQPVVFLSFTPPHLSYQPEGCHALCVFAWEYGTIPDEEFAENPANNWCQVLETMGAAITHSDYTVDVVKRQLGDDYNVSSIPAPIWDDFEGLQQAFYSKSLKHESTIKTPGSILDCHWCENAGKQITEIQNEETESSVSISGVVYTTVTNLNDGRKNWVDSLTAFCHAFKEKGDATLVIKSTYHDFDYCTQVLQHELNLLSPFKCRVVLIDGYLSKEDYIALIKRSNYAVNSSRGEGQCLPLMEFMSAGKPAVAPDHSAMASYLNSDNAFVVDSSLEWADWPHDARVYYRTLRSRINWGSMYDGFLESYRTAKYDAPGYNLKSLAARESLRQYCSLRENTNKMRKFLDTLLTPEKESCP